VPRSQGHLNRRPSRSPGGRGYQFASRRWSPFVTGGSVGAAGTPWTRSTCSRTLGHLEHLRKTESALAFVVDRLRTGGQARLFEAGEITDGTRRRIQRLLDLEHTGLED
jgi:hypothetical protein